MQKNVLRFLLGITLTVTAFISPAQIIQFSGSIHPSDTTFEDPIFFDVAENGDIYILDKVLDTVTYYDYYYYIKKFDADYQLVSKVQLNTEKYNEIYINDFKIGPDGRFYLADGNNGLVIYDKNGELITIYKGQIRNQTTDTIFQYAHHIVFDRQFNVYVGESDYSEGGKIYKFDKNLKFLQLIPIQSSYYENLKFTIDPEGNLYNYYNETANIYKYSPKTKYKAEIYIDSIYSLNNSSSLGVDSKKNFWIANPNSYSFIRFDEAGKRINDFYGVDSYFNNPNQIIFKGDSIYVLDYPYSFGNKRFFAYNYLYPQEVKIIGKRKVPLNSKVTYNIYPFIDNLYYEWSFTGKGMLDLNCNPTNDNSEGNNWGDRNISITDPSTVCYFATDSMTAGWLSCKIYSNFDLYDSIAIYIEPATNTKPYPLTELTCQQNAFSDCSQGSIESIQLNDLVKNSTECNDLGYWDFTTDTVAGNLYIGQYYSAEIQLSSNKDQNQYAGIWIDFNNDGDFDDPNEFLGTAIDFDGKVKIINIEVPATSNYTGDARMRVRARPLSSFSASESCMRIADVGETEDYTVKISESVGLAAPNAITPNLDGKNDFFVIKGISGSDNALVITDSFGKAIHQANNYQNNWPEQSNESKLPKGTYYYFFNSGSTSINGFFVVNY